MKTIYARIRTTKVPGHRIGCFPEGDREAECSNCGNPLRYNPAHADGDIQEVACSLDCARQDSWFPQPIGIREAVSTVTAATAATEKTPKVVKPDTCEECGGPRCRRGYSHTSTCSKGVEGRREMAAQERQKRGNCPECGGPPGRARGWQHKPNCSKKVVVAS